MARESERPFPSAACTSRLFLPLPTPSARVLDLLPPHDRAPTRSFLLPRPRSTRSTCRNTCRIVICYGAGHDCPVENILTWGGIRFGSVRVGFSRTFRTVGCGEVREGVSDVSRTVRRGERRNDVDPSENPGTVGFDLGRDEDQWTFSRRTEGAARTTRRVRVRPWRRRSPSETCTSTTGGSEGWKRCVEGRWTRRTNAAPGTIRPSFNRCRRRTYPFARRFAPSFASTCVGCSFSTTPGHSSPSTYVPLRFHRRIRAPPCPWHMVRIE